MAGTPGASSNGEKYRAELRFRLAQSQRAALRGALRRLVAWRPLEAPAPGYSLIIGCVSSMPAVLHANLTMLERQRRSHLREVIVVFDQPRSALDADLEADLRRRHPALPLRCIFYTPVQARTLGLIRWAWCYSWLSWCLGIAACRTRYALLHDLDALLLREDVLEERYETIERTGCQYLGARYYQGNGIGREDRLAVTFELMFDAAYVRRTFRPTDLFNAAGRIGGRRVEFDTFLRAQARAGRVDVAPVRARDMVHPSQVFCQYTAHRQRRRYVPPEANNLPMLPYLFYLGGAPGPLRRDTALMQAARRPRAVLFGEPMDISRLSQAHMDWLLEQVRRTEHAVAGGFREEVAAYFDAITGLLHQRDRPLSSGEDNNGNGQCAAANGNGHRKPAHGTPRVDLDGVAFDAISEHQCVGHVLDALDAGRGGWIITSNVDHLRRAHRDGEFRAMLAESQLTVADGMPLVWASRVQRTPLPERVAGSSMVSTLAKAAAHRGRSIYLLGGEPGAAEAAARVLMRRYPKLLIAGIYCPPVGFEADRDQMRQLRAAVGIAQPDIVYVALGSPKQERLIRELRGELPDAWWIGVGISLSFLCGQVKRAPRWMQELGLEWLHRLSQEPHRLARRYLVEDMPFLARVMGGALMRRWSRRTVTAAEPPLTDRDLDNVAADTARAGNGDHGSAVWRGVRLGR